MAEITASDWLIEQRTVNRVHYYYLEVCGLEQHLELMKWRLVKKTVNTDKENNKRSCCRHHLRRRCHFCHHRFRRRPPHPAPPPHHHHYHFFVIIIISFVINVFTDFIIFIVFIIFAAMLSCRLPN